jgi:hypothetical protein
MKNLEEMTCKDIDNLNLSNKNSTFEYWYEALQRYAEALGDDWERCLITDCGEECWKEFFDDGYGIKMTIIEGFSE